MLGALRLNVNISPSISKICSEAHFEEKYSCWREELYTEDVLLIVVLNGEPMKLESETLGIRIQTQLR